MWLLIFFDLPVKTKAARVAYTKFRRKLLRYGFSMRQFSVYEMHCASAQIATKYTKKIAKVIPIYGKVSLFRLSDSTFNAALHWTAQKRIKSPPSLPLLMLL